MTASITDGPTFCVSLPKTFCNYTESFKTDESFDKKRRKHTSTWKFPKESAI